MSQRRKEQLALQEQQAAITSRLQEFTHTDNKDDAERVFGDVMVRLRKFDAINRYSHAFREVESLEYGRLSLIVLDTSLTGLHC